METLEKIESGINEFIGNMPTCVVNDEHNRDLFTEEVLRIAHQFENEWKHLVITCDESNNCPRVIDQNKVGIRVDIIWNHGGSSYSDKLYPTS